MFHPLVSIIIPCYNAEKWIAEAIGSALNQTWPNKEVIVIDDGSTDRSLQIIESFSRSIRWETGPNRGGCAARNRGINLADGSWVQFLDADDVLDPDCIRRKIEAPEEQGKIIFCDVRIMGYKGTQRLPCYWARSHYTIETMLKEGALQTAAPLHKREHLELVGGFREGLPCAQDFDLHLRLAIMLGVSFVSNRAVGVLVRPSERSLSRTAGVQMYLALVEVLFHCAELLKAKPPFSSRYQDMIAQRATSLARKLWRMGQPQEAIRIAHQSRQLSRIWYQGAYNYGMASAISRLLGFEFFEKLHGWWRTLRSTKVDSTEEIRAEAKSPNPVL